jgi:O-methyltransferase
MKPKARVLPKPWHRRNEAAEQNPLSPGRIPFTGDANRRAYALSPPEDGNDLYDDQTMRLLGRNLDFLREERFVESYRSGMASGHKFFWPGTDLPIDFPWRAHMACWAATHALKVPGDLVECGVNTGILSLVICNYLNFNSTEKSFYLFDTFTGIPEDQMSEAERPVALAENELFYREDSYATAQANFAPFKNVHLVRGKVPDSLSTVEIPKVCYLSLDMNLAAPEVAAIEYFWPRLSPGAVVLLDDYGWAAYPEQKTAHGAFAQRQGVPIATLPTGQGLLIKPGSEAPAST